MIGDVDRNFSLVNYTVIHGKAESGTVNIPRVALGLFVDWFPNLFFYTQ